MNKLLNAAAILVAKIAEAVNKLQAVKFPSGNFIVFMIIIKKKLGRKSTLFHAQNWLKRFSSFLLIQTVHYFFR